MNHTTVHPVVGKTVSERSLITPESNARIVGNLLRRLRPLVSQSMAAEIDAGLACLEDLLVGLEARL